MRVSDFSHGARLFSMGAVPFQGPTCHSGVQFLHGLPALRNYLFDSSCPGEAAVASALLALVTAGVKHPCVLLGHWVSSFENLRFKSCLVFFLPNELLIRIDL